MPTNAIEIVFEGTHDYKSWQCNHWQYFETDALVFIGDVGGAGLHEGGDSTKIDACAAARAEWSFPLNFGLSQVVIGGQPDI